jgi:CDP-glucose 4,6-dehydratase
LEELDLNMSNPDSNFWKNKRVLITGHTGFKGSWLSLWLNKLGADITGLSLSPIGDKNLYSLLNLNKKVNSNYVDIRDFNEVKSLVKKIKPEIIFHLAAQPLVRASYKNPIETYSTNVMGSVNVLEAIRHYDFVKSLIMVTTDKVYLNKECQWPYREDNRLGGFDPYSASKSATELIVDSYRKSFLNDAGISVSTARAGNVIGGGDWSEDRLIPDLMRALENSGIVEIRSLNSIRPWQHVLEPLLGYIILAEKTYSNLELARAFNFGPDESDAKSVFEIVTMVENLTGKFLINNRTSHNKGHQFHEAGILMLDTSLSKSLIKIVPRWTTKTAIEKTVNWYTKELVGNNAEDLCNRDIDSYLANI